MRKKQSLRISPSRRGLWLLNRTVADEVVMSSLLMVCGAVIVLLSSCHSMSPLARSAGCAHLRNGERCGVSNSGVLVYAVNDHTDRRVRITVREHWQGGGQSGHTDLVHELHAGGEKQVGCTLGSAPPYYRSSFEIIGCEVL